MLAFLIVFSCVLTACTPRRGTASSDSSSNPLKGADASGDTRLNVVTTLFPYYDFLRQIAGDSIRLTMVVPAGMDSHSFEPTPADMITIQNADLLVCNGGTMEQWLSQVLDSFEEGTGPKRVVTMMDCVDVVQEEIVEGMEDGEAHDHDIRMFMRMGTVHAGDHDHESEDHAHSEEEEHEPEDHVYSEEEHEPEDHVYSEEEHTTQKSIFTARMSMIWKMWRFMMKITLKSIWMRTMVTASRLNMTRSTSGHPGQEKAGRRAGGGAGTGRSSARGFLCRKLHVLSG